MTAQAGPAQFAFRAGRRDADDKEGDALVHEVSWYGGRPMTPSNVSMMIIWP
ncbi:MULTISPECIES: hypothetical protein [unclassified Mesorhizobium]|uniref:hypothetical protein n=1 Tax=unclassified Mesorhizobium TaxID=325217 RepID=UPI0003CE5598|nr:MULTISPECIES: hypothetical protein [unclassified Mesorhizobium]ESY46342.1 hypothetical protein X745_30875 [Mesorhizobium sp. LNJC374B00]ESY52287.1 hypothetical protein X744_29710 [Mesorhizobium sp. LNJC372A00]WJI81096.1 hypothetical protein NLY34_31140 [Mesorhizobium sp. C374B]WJI87637.1 hypothetical protein NLY42_01875 [Mesorhizobium sp. C372A]